MRVLVADDDEGIRALLRERFADAARRIVLCGDGWTALREGGTEAFELLILDDSLPGLSGLDVLRRLRERGIRAPALILTAGFDAGVEGAAEALAPTAVLPKPFERRELREATAYLVRRIRF